MRIALTTIGSRGDLQPYISLAIELQKNDHTVTILTHPWAKNLCNLYGLTHTSIGSDVDINYTIKYFVENSTNNLKGFKLILNFLYENLRMCHKDLLTALEDFDLVIGHGIIGKTESDILGLPFVMVSIETMGIEKVYWQSNNFIIELGIYLSDKLKTSIFGKPYLKFRKEVGAPPFRNKKEYTHLTLVPISPNLQNGHNNWKNFTEITGYFFAGTPKEYLPSQDLTDFLNGDEKPILITYGSMYHKQEQANQLFRIVCEAVKLSKSRAVLLMTDLDCENMDVPDDVFIVNQIPYSWLLDKVSLVVHHFGFGTTAEVLKAGLPSIPIPHIFDQKIRSSHIYNLGYAHKPLDIRKLTSKKLSNALHNVKANKELQQKCLDTGNEISRENGVKKAVGLINKYFN